MPDVERITELLHLEAICKIFHSTSQIACYIFIGLCQLHALEYHTCYQISGSTCSTKTHGQFVSCSHAKCVTVAYLQSVGFTDLHHTLGNSCRCIHRAYICKRYTAYTHSCIYEDRYICNFCRLLYVCNGTGQVPCKAP